MRYAHGSRSTVVGTANIAMLSLYATAAKTPAIREIGVTNTTSTALTVAVARFTTATNVGAGLTEVSEADPVSVAEATVFAGHVGAGGVGGILRYASLGAAVGAGVIWTFGGNGLVIPAGTANGVGIITPTGTGQICDCYIVWDE
jgi:hypothetical protein